MIYPADIVGRGVTFPIVNCPAVGIFISIEVSRAVSDRFAAINSGTLKILELSTPSRQSNDSTMVILALKHARITEISEQNEGFRFCKKSEPATVPYKKDHKFASLANMFGTFLMIPSLFSH